MAILDRLMEVKFYIIVVFIFAVALFSVIRLGPSVSTVINFFWPLLVSTGFFLAAVAVLLRISPPPAPETVGEKTGEELMDYVAGQPDSILKSEAEADEEKDEPEAAQVLDHHNKSE